MKKEEMFGGGVCFFDPVFTTGFFDPPNPPPKPTKTQLVFGFKGMISGIFPEK